MSHQAWRALATCRVPHSGIGFSDGEGRSGGHFWKASDSSPRDNGCGRSIACYGGQMYITEIPDEIFVDKNRNEIINVVVGRFPKNVE